MNQTEDLMLPPLPDYKRLGDTSTRSGIYGYTADQMREYAELVRADAREACAKEYEELAENAIDAIALRFQQIATAIRARGNT